MEPEDETNSEEDVSEFCFIDLTNRGLDSRRKNLVKVRSHVMKGIRRRHRGDKLKLISDSRKTIGSKSDIDSHSISTSIDGSMMKCVNSAILRIETDILPTLTYTWKWTPWEYHMLHFSKFYDLFNEIKLIFIAITTVLNSIFPTTSEISTGALDVWQTIRSSSMAIHAVISGSAVHLDWQNKSDELSKSPEALAHRGQALRLINQEISQLEGKEPSDALLLAILALTPNPPTSTQIFTTSNSQTFQPSQTQLGWEHNRLNVRYSQTHHHGLFTLVKQRGGLKTFQKQAVARMISSHDLGIATQELRTPRQPFIQDIEISNLISNPNLNIVEPNPYESTPGLSLPELIRTIGSNPLSSVLLQLQRIVATTESRRHDTLRNINIPALYGEKQSLHHAVLSLRPYSDSLYESLRIATLIYVVGIFFPVPPSTGTFAYLVQSMKASIKIDVYQLQDIHIKALTWILFIGGMAAKGMPQRDWYIANLSKLVKLQDLSKWIDVKQLLRSFVWLSHAMDDEAISLWEDIRRSQEP